jgi:hypothetical protein
MMRLDELQPSQLFISSEKLTRIENENDPKWFDRLEPIPIKELDGQIVLTDGHTRALFAFLNGHSEIPVTWDEDELDWEAYRICVAWCREARIATVADLRDRVLDPETYESCWHERCRQMQHNLAQQRRNNES